MTGTVNEWVRIIMELMVIPSSLWSGEKFGLIVRNR